MVDYSKKENKIKYMRELILNNYKKKNYYVLIYANDEFKNILDRVILNNYDNLYNKTINIIVNNNDVINAYKFCAKVVNDGNLDGENIRCDELEDVIINRFQNRSYYEYPSSHITYLNRYYNDIIKGRWKKLEEFIFSDDFINILNNQDHRLKFNVYLNILLNYYMFLKFDLNHGYDDIELLIYKIYKNQRPLGYDITFDFLIKYRKNIESKGYLKREFVDYNDIKLPDYYDEILLKHSFQSKLYFIFLIILRNNYDYYLDNDFGDEFYENYIFDFAKYLVRTSGEDLFYNRIFDCPSSKSLRELLYKARESENV